MLLECHAQARCRDSDVVEHDVQSTEAIDRARHGGRHVGVLGHVAVLSDRCAVRRLNQCHRFFGPVKVDVGAHDRRSLLGEAQSGCSAHARAGAGDDGNLSFEPHAFAHFPSSSVRSARVPVGHASIAVEMLSTGSLGLSISTETAEGPDQAPAMTGISAGVNRYSFSALPRRSLYCVSGGRCPMIFFTTVMQLGHVESECG